MSELIETFNPDIGSERKLSFLVGLTHQAGNLTTLHLNCFIFFVKAFEKFEQMFHCEEILINARR